ncbi:DUF262 domain-containing protein [Pseudaquabacterium pictum]|uniref:DUF262 domain-containing protein n=1 Tax=Pseudaquabacterium pictum TaxID=2315236 RepID=A0A480AUF6_9BURK|nr:DUF262 domain-containing protein [Rubrivivax pictus]GCL64500.1 hypothetical protein AQPW35_35810 [Rubrivivax pictus]
MKIQCVDRDVRQILESGTYVIPRFQRPFSWDRENVEEFWGDSTSDVKKDYFIGAFVTYNISSSSYGIVDGQQRLTTITITLCAIRDKYLELGHTAAAKGVHRLIETRDLNDQAQFVLRAETSYPFLQAKIQSFEKEEEVINAGDEERAIGAAYETINGFIKSGVDRIASLDAAKAKAATKRWLDQIRDKILALKVISITLDNQDDAYTIFETLNTRGKDLTAADLAKNHFLRLLPAKGKAIDRPKDHWLEMQTELEHAQKPIQLRTFLHHYWLSKHPFTTEKQLFRAIRDTVNALNVKDIVAELRSDSTLYRGISEPEVLDFWTRTTADVKDSLYCISNILNIQIANPLLLSVLRLYNAKKLKDGQVREVFSLVERYHYTYTTICALPSSGGVSLMYAAHARDFANAADSNALGICITDFKKKVKDKVPARDVFISKFKQLNYLNTRQRDVLRYTLWNIDKSRNAAVDIDRASSSLEHLSPQANHNYWTHYIGNLLLVPIKFNGDKLGSKSFVDKKVLLTAGGYALDSHVLAATAWTHAEVEKRTQELAEYAYDTVWAIK